MAAPSRIDILLRAYLGHTITGTELDELLAADEQKLDQAYRTYWQEIELKGLITERDWDAKLRALLAGQRTYPEQAMPEVMQKEKPVLRFGKQKWTKWVAAASIVGLVALGAWLYFNSRHTAGEVPLAYTKPIQPGKTGAILTLSNGKVINLDTAGNGLVTEGFEKQDDLLTVSPDQQTVQYAILEAPRGRTISAKLPDGTLVWLNSASSIRFPVSFTGASREVTVTGESYFEVAKDPVHPFVVQTRSDRIEVLGTHFNINAYDDEDFVKTTLLEGKVKVNDKNGREVMLVPEEQYENGKVRRVITTDVVAWKNGFVAVRNADVKILMKQLSKWYDIQVSYEGAVTDQLFTGEIDRNLGLGQVLDGISGKKLHYRVIDDKHVVILP